MGASNFFRLKFFCTLFYSYCPHFTLNSTIVLWWTGPDYRLGLSRKAKQENIDENWKNSAFQSPLYTKRPQGSPNCLLASSQYCKNTNTQKRNRAMEDRLDAEEKVLVRVWIFLIVFLNARMFAGFFGVLIMPMSNNMCNWTGIDEQKSTRQLYWNQQTKNHRNRHEDCCHGSQLLTRHIL